ncbi:MAG: hypothetical protein JWL85_976 [Candidatus Saccharibacteria bacterium]|nr:hypothetical protein [Candidatus Saccharibacteria bacterium]
MTLNEYQKEALVTAVFADDEFKDLMHWMLGLSGETGEIAEKLKKIIRDKDGVVSEEDRIEIIKEMGDVLWYLAVLAKHFDTDLDEVAAGNIKKLRSRQARGVISGNGDNR